MASLGGIEAEFDDVKPSLFGMSHTISKSISYPKTRTLELT